MACHEAPEPSHHPQAPVAGEATPSPSPAPVPIAIDGGYDHMCALDSAGSVRCWGDNTRGQLGYGNTSPISEDQAATRSTPVPTGGRVRQIAVGGYHTCVLLDGGDVRCWGDNRAGQIGAPWPKQVALPTEIASKRYGGGKWASREAMKRGYSWDAASVDPILAVGDDELPTDNEPIVVPDEVTQLAAGSFHSCVLTESGRVFCWGWLDGPEPRPLHEVPLPRPAVEVVAGKRMGCVRFADGGVRCWGENRPGRAWHCTTPSCRKRYAALDPADPHDSALLDGFGRLGYLAVDHVVSSDVATRGDLGEDFGPWTEPGPFPRDLTSMTAGEHQVCGIRKNGTVACWGDSLFSVRSNVDPDLLRSEVGWGHVSYREAGEVRSLGAKNPIVTLASTGIDVCAVEQRGDVRCFGGPPLPSSAGPMWLAGQRQAEHKPTLDAFPAVPISERAKAVAVRTERACAILTSGTVACWGRLGDHRTIRWNAPSGPP